MTDPLALPLWFLCFVLSVTCHEAAHAWAAKRGGDTTAEEEGLLTINPLPHMRREPIGMILAPLIGLFSGGFTIGWGSCPYDPQWQSRYPRRAAWMAAAGPAANLILMLLAVGLIYAGIYSEFFFPPDRIRFSSLVEPKDPRLSGLALFASILLSNNLVLFVFNLLPLPPLDGATVIGLFTSEEIALKIAEFRSDPRWTLLGLFCAWQLMDVIAGPIFTAALKVLYPWLDYH